MKTSNDNETLVKDISDGGLCTPHRRKPVCGIRQRLTTFLIVIIGVAAAGYSQEQPTTGVQATQAEEVLPLPATDVGLPTTALVESSAAEPDTSSYSLLRANMSEPAVLSLYELPYSRTLEQRNWDRLWVNTLIFAGAYIGTLAVLECLPEGATNWNREEITSKAWYTRWVDNVFRRGPEWDSDSYVFNYILHPYAGAVYFMAARTAGFNFYRSLLYCSLVSTVGWEFGIEACMERPSVQDISITPLVGSVIGELFYCAKRHIIANGYCLSGSRILGELVCFLIDPVNCIVDLVSGTHNQQSSGCCTKGVTSSLSPAVTPYGLSLSFRCTF